MSFRGSETPLRRGWTTGACATAASKAAYQALLTGEFPDPVTITLPQGQQPAFALACEELSADCARAGIIKDAGDDPDVTHGALIIARVTYGPAGQGIVFYAGPGVGTVTRPGLPINPGEPAINPIPRQMMRAAIAELAQRYNASTDVDIEISIPKGERLAQQTWNPRLGIVGGLSILGTTGVVIPYSCSAWIHSIQRGIDVARASGLQHVAGCTGATSEHSVQALYDMPDIAMLDMGDFVGGLLKYLRRHPLPRLTLGGGFGKLSKLAMGQLDLHSSRSQVDIAWLVQQAQPLTRSDEPLKAMRAAHNANQVLLIAQDHRLPLADRIAEQARQIASQVLSAVTTEVEVDVVIIDRSGVIVGRSSGHC